MPFSSLSHPVWAVCRATSPCQWRLGGLRAGRLPLPALPVAGQSVACPTRRGPERPRRPPPARPAQGQSLRRHPLAGGGMSPHAAPPRSYPPLSWSGLRAGRPEPSRCARPHRSLRSLPLTSVPVPPLTMPRVARAPAIPPPPPLLRRHPLAGGGMSPHVAPGCCCGIVCRKM